jgi:UDP-N-acetylmuramate--alanine ligase
VPDSKPAAIHAARSSDSGPETLGAAPLRDILARSERPHLIGVGGTGMSSLATLLLDMGKAVSGSDSGSDPTLDRLAARGVLVHREHRAEQVARADLVIFSAAIPGENPELAEARRLALPTASHAQALGALMAAKRGIAVAGTHGKSTTTALVAHVLASAGRDPTLVGGAESLDFGAGSRLGHGPELVAEADEYDRRFLQLHPQVAVITNVEPDHLDYYRDLAEIVATFEAFVGGMPADGVAITGEDSPALAGLALPRRRIRYGAAASADWRLERYEPAPGGGCRFEVADPRGRRRRHRLALSGRHHAENALAAIVVADLIGLGEPTVADALASFRGTRRRFETKLRANGVWIVDDYAHHPTEIRANLRAAREAHAGPIWAVFQPHTAHRTAALLDDFATAFADADHVVITPIYRPAGREVAAPPITSGALAERIDHPDVRAVDSFEAALAALAPALRPGTLVLTLGAGDITAVADRLAERVLSAE